METDTQFFRIFQAEPDFINDILGAHPPRRYRFQSESVKGLDRHIDGVFYPEDEAAPILVLEIQGYREKAVYHRLLEAIAGLSRLHGCRPVYGALLFLRRECDPRTEPFHALSRSGIPWFQAFLLEEACGRLTADHPLAALFFPFYAGGNDCFMREAPGHCRALHEADLKPEVKAVFLDVFLSWTMVRFSKKTTREVKKMLGMQEALESSVAYQEIKAEGREEGYVEGRIAGNIELLQQLREEGLLAEVDFMRLVNPLRATLAEPQSARDSWKI